MAAPDTKSRYESKGLKFATVAEIKPNEVPKLVQDMRKAFATDKTYSKDWRVRQLQNMHRMILECKDELSEAMFKDLHKSAFESFVTELGLAISEIENTLQHLSTWMAPVKKANSPLNIPSWSTTQPDPLGLVLVMGAWNYPMQISLVPMIGAIAAGNCVVLKPGSYAINSSNSLARCILRYMDPECVRVVEGNRDVTSALLKERWDKIFFTGSGFVGRVVARAAAENLTPCVLELGGKSPCIIDKGVDIQHAVQRLVWSTFLNGGQTCVRPDFLVVHEDVADAVFECMGHTIRSLYGENPQLSENFGRCINQEACSRLAQLVTDNRPSLIFGGVVDAKDRYISPTVFDFKSNSGAFSASSLMKDELFGPLLPCLRFRDLNSVIELIRNLPTGKPLALYLFSQDAKTIHEVKSRTSSGGLCVNDCIMHLVNDELPFGGVGSSGMGKYHGKYSFECFSHEKACLEKSQLLDQSFLFKPLLAARFPPYTPMKRALIGIFTNHLISRFLNAVVPTLRGASRILVLLVVLYMAGFRVSRVQ